MNPFLIVSSLFLFVAAVRSTDEVPVVVWGKGLEDVNFHVSPFKKVSMSEFHKDFLNEVISHEPPAMIVFVKNSLSPENFEKSAYPLVEEMIESSGSVKYLPYVSNPLKALDMLNYEKQKVSLQWSPAVSESTKVLFMVKLKDTGDDEERLKSLQSHDKVIKELCTKVQEKYERAVCILTAEQPSWVESKQTHTARKLLQTSNTANNNKDKLNVYFKDDVGMIFSRYPPIVFIKSSGKSFNLSSSSTSKISKEGNSLVVPLSYESNEISVSFNFIPDNSSVWLLNSTRFNGSDGKISPLTLNSSIISASFGNSFHTPSNVTFDGDKYQLIFKGLQAQYFSSTQSERFGPAEDSVYFFTIPILSGLFVTSLLVAIVLIGLTMIFEIKTMDQFDDPKGKSITINASD